MTSSVWTNACLSTSLVDSRPVRFRSGYNDVLLVRIDGTAYAVDNVCTHANACLHEGRVRGARVICPLHGASFDLRTGAVLGKPAITPLQRHETREIDDRVEVLLPL